MIDYNFRNEPHVMTSSHHDIEYMTYDIKFSHVMATLLYRLWNWSHSHWVSQYTTVYHGDPLLLQREAVENTVRCLKILSALAEDCSSEMLERCSVAMVMSFLSWATSCAYHVCLSLWQVYCFLHWGLRVAWVSFLIRECYLALVHGYIYDLCLLCLQILSSAGRRDGWHLFR